MEISVPYPDITEIGKLMSKAKVGERLLYVSTPTIEECLVDAEEKVQTELAFVHIPEYEAGSGSYSESYTPVIAALQKQNWELVSKTLNWHRLHRGDHPIALWMKKFPAKTNIFGPLPNRKIHITPGYAVDGENVVFGFGCGGRLTEGLTKKFKLTRHKALTLLRIPRTTVLEAVDYTWLSQHRYRATYGTRMAQYFVNGWHPGSYLEEKERGYWEGWENHAMSLRKAAPIEED